jgi:hypothetical protein
LFARHRAPCHDGSTKQEHRHYAAQGQNEGGGADLGPHRGGGARSAAGLEKIDLVGGGATIALVLYGMQWANPS